MATCDTNLVQNALGIQQTGPRTVIVPADPIIWQEDRSYEYLTLVTSIDFGQAYISKRDVPSGTPLTDTNYWIPSASYNAQLAEVQKTIKSVQTDMTNLEDQVSQSIANMTDKVRNPYEVIGWIGDSYSSPNSASFDWVSMVAKALGSTITNEAVGGAGFLSATNNFEAQLNALHATTPNPDLIVLYGGENDSYNLWNETNLANAINSFIGTYKRLFPGVPLMVFGYTFSSTIATRVERYHEILMYRLYQSGMRFSFKNVLNLLFDKQAYISSDNMHPSEAGCQYLAETFISRILGGENCYPPNTYQYNSAIAGITVSSNNIVTLSNGKLIVSPHNITKDDSYTETFFRLINFTNPLLGAMGEQIKEFNWYTYSNGTNVGSNINPNYLTSYISTSSNNGTYNINGLTIDYRISLSD